MSEREVLEKKVEQIMLENKRLKEDRAKVREVIPPSGSSTVAQSLSPQFATEPRFIAAGRWDMRKLSVIDKKQLLALTYLLQRGKKVKYYREFVDEFLNLAPSVGGRRIKEMIKMQMATGGPQPEMEPERPGWVGRHVTNRGWDKEE